MPKMNPEWKDKWLNALRSGEYQQGKSYLCKDNAFCCLGVLYDLGTKTDPGTYRWEHDIDEGYSRTHDNTFGALPDDFSEETGVEPFGVGKDDVCLARLNDQGATFLEIADIIEKEF